MKLSVTFFRHTYHSKEKGRAERFIDTFKRNLLKLWAGGGVDNILDKFVLAYMTTPYNTLRQRWHA
jgi:hypothetical protein